MNLNRKFSDAYFLSREQVGEKYFRFAIETRDING